MKKIKLGIIWSSFLVTLPIVSCSSNDSNSSKSNNDLGKERIVRLYFTSQTTTYWQYQLNSDQYLTNVGYDYIQKMETYKSIAQSFFC